MAKKTKKPTVSLRETNTRISRVEAAIGETDDLVKSEVKRTDGISSVAQNHERRIIGIGQQLGETTSTVIEHGRRLGTLETGVLKLTDTVKSVFGLYSRNRGDIAVVSERVDNLEQDFDEATSITLGKLLLITLMVSASAWLFLWNCGRMSEKVRAHELFDFILWGVPILMAAVLTLICLILVPPATANRRTRTTTVVIEPTPAPTPSTASVPEEAAPATEPVPVVS